MIQLKPGETHKVWLEKEGVGGYTWVLKGNTPPAGLLVAHCKEQPIGHNMPGASVGVYYCIKALKMGNYTLVFELKRGWENKTVALEQKTLEIVVG
jgi:predicted secreted protein